MSTSPSQYYAVVFIDIVGSTRLYETAGDEIAKDLVMEIETEIARIVTESGGQVVEIIGDEVMCRFDDVNKAVSTAISIHESAGLFSMQKGVNMPVRIGLHYGPAIIENGRMFGDTVNTAARMAGIAQGQQIITTEQVVAGLSGELSSLARRFDAVRVKGKVEKLVIYDLVWSKDDVTQIQSAPYTTGLNVQQIVISYRGEVRALQPGEGSFTIGRSNSCSLVVHSESASRIHASLDFTRGKFVLTDRSTNGTYVLTHDLQSIYLRRESLPLVGSGQIGFGEPVSDQNPNLVRYQYEPVSLP